MNLHRNCLSLHVSVSRVDWWEHTSQINCSYRENTPDGNSSANIADLVPRSAFPEKVGVYVSRETHTPSRYSNLLDETGLMKLRRSIYPSDQSRSFVPLVRATRECIYAHDAPTDSCLSQQDHCHRDAGPASSSDVALPSIEARRSHPPSRLNPTTVVDRAAWRDIRPYNDILI